jgi:uncharacterized membrane protein YtjA (UPF0391 family)
VKKLIFGECGPPTTYKEMNMLHWSLTFLIIAIIAAFLGFSGIAGTATEFAKILFVVFLIVWIISFIFGRRSGV